MASRRPALFAASTKALALSVTGFLMLVVMPREACAQITYYWDSNGATAGFGNATGTWGTSTFWSTDAAGTSATANSTITTSDTVNFGTATLNYANATVTGPSAAQGFLNLNFGAGQTTALTISGGTLNLASSSTITQNSTSATMTVSSVLQGSGSALTKTGAGALTLSGSNTFSGNLTLQGNGTLNLQHSNAAGAGTIFLKSTQASAGTTLGISGGITVANAIVIDSTTGRENITSTGTGNNAVSGGITITGAGANAMLIQHNHSGNLTISGGISGASFASTISLRGSATGNVGFVNGAITLSSTGVVENQGSTTWTLNTAGSTYLNFSIRSTGNAILAVDNALATGAYINFTGLSTGALDLNGYSQSAAGLLSATPTTGNGGIITNNGTSDSVLTLSGLTSNRIYLGTITDGPTNKISLVMNSAGRTQTLNATSTYSGDTTITAGTLVLGSNLAIQNSALDTSGSGTVTLASGITTPTIGGLSGSKNLSTVITGNYSLMTSLTLNPGTGVTKTYSGNITNGAAGMTLTKTGNGTQVLSGTNTYTGTTNITGGTLLAINTSGSATGSGNVMVASGATLGGTGTIGGTTTTAGIISPGDGGIGTLNITGNVTWQGASSNGTATDWIFQLGASNAADLLNITGDFNMDAATFGSNFRFNFLGATNTGTFKLVDWTGNTTFSGNEFGYTNLASGLSGSFSLTGSQLNFTVSAVPEPSTWVAMATLAITGGTMAKRRRNR